MHSFELQSKIESFLIELKTAEPFTAVIALLSKASIVINNHLPGIAQGGSALNNSAAQLHSYLVNFQGQISEINQRQFFKALEHFQGSLSCIDFSNEDNEVVDQLKINVEQFANLYDAFLSNRSATNALSLILGGSEIQAKLKTLLEMLDLFKNLVFTNDIPNNSESEISLWLPEHLTVNEFAKRILAVQSLYTELCMLLSISEIDHPLRISRIESGSLWAKLFGESRVIGMMINFIEKSATWIYRSYTAEGKLTGIPSKVEAIESLLGLSKQLTDAGIDTSEMHSHIQKSAVIISKELSSLLDGQGSVVINNKSISLHGGKNKNLLGHSASLRLENLNAGDSENSDIS